LFFLDHIPASESVIFRAIPSKAKEIVFAEENEA